MLTNKYGTRTVQQSFKGRVNIVNRVDSEFGNRWSLIGLDRLHTNSAGGVLIAQGAADAFWFKENGVSNFQRPEGEPGFSALTINGSGFYELRSRHGMLSTFNGAGLLISRRDPNGNQTTYQYLDADGDGPDDIWRITDPWQRVTTFAYVNGRVSGIIDFAGRTTSLNYDPTEGTLLSVIKPDPDGAGIGVPAPVNTFGYDSSTQLMTSWTSATSGLVQFGYDAAGRLRSMNENGHPSSLFPTQAVGWIDYTLAGNPGTASNPAQIPNRPTQATGTYVDAHGVTSQYTVDRFGYQSAAIDALGNSFTQERNANGQLRDLVLPSPNAQSGTAATLHTLNDYDSQGNVLLMTLPDGSKRHWTYEPNFNQATRYIDELGRVTLYDVSLANGNVLSMTQVVGADDSLSGETNDLKWTYTYTTSGVLGLLQTATDPLGRVTRYTYVNSPTDPARHGQLSTVINADGITNFAATESYLYDSRGNVSFVTDAELRTTGYLYDHLDRLTRVTLPDIDPNDGVFVQPQIRYEYDAADRVTKVIDSVDPLTGIGNETIYVYCGCGRLQEVIEEHPTARGLPQSQRPTTKYLYEANGRLMAIIEPSGLDGLERRTDYGYDALDRLRTVTLPDPDGPGQLQRPIYTTVYGAQGHVLEETDALNNVTSYHIDNRGRADIVSLPFDGSATPVYQTVYDAAGQVLQEIDPFSRVTRYRYDALGRLVRTHNPVTGTTSFAYDKNSNLTSQTDAVGRVTAFLYDARDRQTKITDPRLGVTQFTYDKVNNLLSLRDPQQNLTTFGYNNWDLLKQETNQLGASRFYVYGSLTGDLQRVTDRNGRVTELGYDNQHRLTSEIWKDFLGGPAVRTIGHTYDFADQLTIINDSDSTYRYTYDGLGRATTISNLGTPISPTVILTQSFDKLSRRTGLSATIGGVADFVNAYQYDGLSRMTRVTQTDIPGGNLVADKRVDVQYNLLGQFAFINRYSSLDTSQVVASSTYSYEAGTQRLAGLRHASGSFGSGATLANYTWSYDTLGRVRTFFSANDSNDTASYFYDKTDQLTAVSHNVLTSENENYGYDLTGNRTDSNFNTTTNNRLQSDGVHTYAYDFEGNLATRSKPGEHVTYTWDHRNRLIEVAFRTAAGGAVIKRVTYTYDVFDRRIGKQVMENGAVVRSERFVYDGPELALAFADPDGAGTAPLTLANRYLHGPAIDQILADERIDLSPGQPEDIAWPLPDNQGSVRDVIFAGGIEHLRFDSFGEIVSDSHPSFTHRFSYTGREFDADVGLYYYRARWYDPVTHRFISEDPIAYDNRNLARYVRNNPTNRKDPSGLEPVGPRPDRPMDVDEFYRRILGGKVMDDRYIKYREGCQGLFKIRVDDVIVPKGARCFDTLQAALHYARRLVEDGHLPHVYAVQSGSPFRPLSGRGARDGELDPHSFVPNDPNFASRIMQNGEPLWEWINRGWTKGRKGDEVVKCEPRLPMYRTRLYTAYCVTRTRDLKVTPRGMGPEAGPDFDRRNRQPY